jgi:hypothetical protein
VTVRWTRPPAEREKPSAPVAPRARALALLVAFGVTSLAVLVAVAALATRG